MNGAELRLSYLESDTDVERYQGHNYPWIGFDELGNYATDYCFNFMMMCNRSSNVDQEWVRMRATGNPGGPGHAWLKERFIEGKEPYKVYTESLGKDANGKEFSLTSCFVPAVVMDNSALMQSNPQYIARLKMQPERIRKAMLDGCWDIKGGGEFFDEFDSAIHVVRPTLLKGDWSRFYCMDWGYKSPYAVLKLAVNPEGMVVVYGEIYGQGFVDGKEKARKGTEESSADVAARVAMDMAAEGVTECIADYNMWQQTFSELNPVDAFLAAGINMIKANKKHDIGWNSIHELLKARDEFGNPYLRIFSTCKYLIRELETLQIDKTNFEELGAGQDDHAADALRYGLVSCLYRHRREMAAVIGGEAPQVQHYDPLKSGYWAKKY
jgi:hypothetical protein